MASFWVGLVTIAALGGTIWQSKQALGISSRALEAEFRPWLDISKVEPIIHVPPPHSDLNLSVEVAIAFMNEGKTPATDLSFRWRVTTDHRNGFADLQSGAPLIAKGRYGSAIFPGRQSDSTVSFGIPDGADNFRQDSFYLTLVVEALYGASGGPRRYKTVQSFTLGKQFNNQSVLGFVPGDFDPTGREGQPHLIQAKVRRARTIQIT